jgi:ribosome-associated protein
MAKTNQVRTKTPAVAARRQQEPPIDAGETPRKRARKSTAPRKARLPKAVTGAVQAALDKKASDLVVLDLRKAGGFTDYFVICTANNSRQMSAIADGVRETLKKDYDERPALAEGVEKSEWILLDYFNFVVHVFSRECRAFYDLERLWGNADRIEVEPPPPSTAS